MESRRKEWQKTLPSLMPWSEAGRCTMAPRERNSGQEDLDGKKVPWGID
jgi:hypothetical protein